MNQKVSALAISHEFVFAATLCGQVHWWSLAELKSEMSKPAFQNDHEVDMEEMVDQTPFIHKHGSLTHMSIGSVNQMEVQGR